MTGNKRERRAVVERERLLSARASAAVQRGGRTAWRTVIVFLKIKAANIFRAMTVWRGRILTVCFAIAR